MRHIFHEILARYLDGDQAAFDASPRELWPEQRFPPGELWPERLFPWHAQAAAQADGRTTERGLRPRVHRELEPQN